MNLKYKSIFFDFDDTLWDIHVNGRDAMAETFEMYKLEKHFESFDAFYDIYMFHNLSLWEKYRQGTLKKADLVLLRFTLPLQKGGIYDEAFALKMNDDFLEATTTKTRLIPYAKEILDYLSPFYRLFIISNGFSEVQYKKLKNSGLAGYFKKIILSEDVQANKPNPVIFDYALKCTNSRRNESLMIGDSWEADIVGAKNSRIDQVFFNREQKTELKFQPTFLINQLEELRNIL